MIDCKALQLPHVKSSLQPLTQSFLAGQRWAIIGPNGIGKSVLLACLAGWNSPKAGVVQWAVAPEANHAHVWAQRVSYQSAQVESPFADSLAQRLSVHQRALQTEATPKTAQLVSAFGLENLLYQSLQSASSGEQQRAWLVIRLLQPSASVMLDEPLAHLDFAFQQVIGEQLRDDSRLSICVVHQPEWAAAYCTHVLALTISGEVLAAPVAQMDGVFLQRTYGVNFALATTPSGSRHWVRLI